ncbi:MAG: cache domain-containing protein [Methyloceanibacter sp.]|jgi:signal transduction histidine kinase
MLRNLILVTASTALIFGATLSARSAEYGTKEEARAMLDQAVAAVKADEAQALAMFNDAEGGFRDRDLYVFCANASDGIETAHPTAKGQQLGDIKDVNGFAFGGEILNNATEGSVGEIDYFWPRPGSDTPAAKSTFFTKVGDQICAVGYYK